MTMSGDDGGPAGGSCTAAVRELVVTLEPIDAACTDENAAHYHFIPAPAGGPWSRVTWGASHQQSGSGTPPNFDFVLLDFIDDGGGCGTSAGEVGGEIPLWSNPGTNGTHAFGTFISFGDGIKVRTYGTGPTTVYLRFER